MSSCFFVKTNINGGGNSQGFRPIVVRRTAAIGDTLCASVIVDKLFELGLDVIYQTHPDCHCVLRLKPRLHNLTIPNGHCDVNLDGAYEKHPSRRQFHFTEMFVQSANNQLRQYRTQLTARNCKVTLRKPLNSMEAVRSRIAQYPKPWVFICPRSNSFNVRQVPDGIWHDAAKHIDGTKFWLGTHPAPDGIVDLQIRHFDTLIAFVAIADLIVTVETGPMHVAAAFGIPMIVIKQATDPDMTLNDQNDFYSVSANLDCLHCQKNLCPKDAYMPPCQQVSPEVIANAANRKLRGMVNDVSAIVAIYQPEPHTLNRCLEALLPQVQEIIVTAEGNSTIPTGALDNSKIRYVRKLAKNIGYGRNCNFGARHSHGKYLLLINDDVFLDPGAVERMRAEMTSGVAAVSHFLRYPGGDIYYAGKIRSPGVRGWGHVDHRKYFATIKEPFEAENMCGASVLVRREAFYGVNCFDEDFHIYAEDDDFMLRLRRAGWKLRYTPHATGVHMEGQSTRKLGRPTDLVNKANQVFSQKWGAYLDWNLHRVPGNFDYLNA